MIIDPKEEYLKFLIMLTIRYNINLCNIRMVQRKEFKKEYMYDSKYNNTLKFKEKNIEIAGDLFNADLSNDLDALDELIASEWNFVFMCLKSKTFNYDWTMVDFENTKNYEFYKYINSYDLYWESKVDRNDTDPIYFLLNRLKWDKKEFYDMYKLLINNGLFNPNRRKVPASGEPFWCMLTTAKLKKTEYNVYYPYKDSEKVMLYTGKVPNVKLFKIYTAENIRHQDILGSLFALNIDSSCFGDIVLYDGDYYVFITEEMSLYVKDNLKQIGKSKVTLEEVSLSTLDNYEILYEEHEIIISSLRIDNVVSSIINSSRSKALEKLKNKEAIVNYETMNKNSYILKENDIFSIRKYGKYKFVGIVKSTKKNHYMVKYLRYV